MKQKKFFAVVLSLLLLFENANIKAVSAEESLLPAFPGAEGGGMYTQGARAAKEYKIYHVTNLNDSGEGSFRAAVSRSNRIIVFDVSGTIMLDDALIITSSNLTILGQTAPGEGICIGGSSVIFDGSKNIILRYLRFRAGAAGGGHEGHDALGGTNCENVIVDHCSASWSNDEVFSWYGNKNFTAQWNIISEPLNAAGHGYGGLWGGINASFHHNLLASCYSRLPRIATCETVSSTPDDESLIDVRNNVIYNWGLYAGYGGENGVRVNLVNNYYKPTGNAIKTDIYRLYYGHGGSLTDENGEYLPQATTLYAEGNVYEGSEKKTEDNWSCIAPENSTYWIKRESIDAEGTVMHNNEPAELAIPEGTGKNDQYIYDYPVATQTAEQAYEDVLLYAGASRSRDVTDERIVKDVINGTFTRGSKRNLGFIDSQNDVGGWCVLAGGEKPTDTDGDGIPDEWEDENGLNKNDADDAVKITSSGYTNIEEYANELAANPEEKTTDRIALNLAIKNIDNTGDDTFVPSSAEELHKAADEGRRVFSESKSQSEIDETAARLQELLENAVINYRPVLIDYIEEVSSLDRELYTFESLKIFDEAVEKANADIEANADNDTMLGDFETLKAAYEGLVLSTKPELLSAVAEAEALLKSEGDEPTAALGEAVDRARALAESDSYTNALLDEAKAGLEMLTETARKYDSYVSIFNREILGEKYLTEESKAAIRQAKEDFFAERASKTATAESIKAAAEKAETAIKNAEYGIDWKNADYTENFENGGEYDFAELAAEGGNTYLKPKAGENEISEFQTVFPVKTDGDVIYLSADIKALDSDDGRAFGIANSFTLEDGTNLSVSLISISENEFSSEGQYVRVIRYGSEGKNIYKDIELTIKNEEWHDLTSRYNKKTGRLDVYLNNACIYSVVSADDANKEIADIGIIPLFSNDMMFQTRSFNNALDNFAVFEEISGLELFACGDVNADGSITSADSAEVLQKVLNNAYSMPIENKTDNWLDCADVSGDGELTANDSALILQKALISTFKMPIEERED